MLQRAAGNRAVTGLLQAQRCGPVPCDCSPEERSEHAKTNPRPTVQRISYDGCEVQEGDVRDAHNQAKTQVANTIAKLRAYDGSQADVRAALQQHFHGTSQIVAFAVANHLTAVSLMVDAAQYECHQDESNGSALASTTWCVPFTDIRLWKPWFQADIRVRTNTLVHEWMHKYDCAFDLGYDYEEIYRQSGTIRALLNAEPYGNIAQALG
jgi:hypothetical protein